MSENTFNDSTERQDPSKSSEPQESTETDARLEQSAQVELLTEENRRLRAEYARARQSRYRRTAIGLAVIGLVALCGGLLFPDNREVFVAFGATGLFGAVLTYYLTPGQFVAADVGERVYAASAANGEAIATELGLSNKRVYLPSTQSAPAQLYVPVHSESDLPVDRDGPFVLDRTERGLLLEATGARLFAEFERALTGELASTPELLVSQLCDGVVEQFELADSVDPDVDVGDGRVTIAISGSTFGAVDQFDHPIASFLAVGLAQGLEQSIELDVDEATDRAEWLVTCRFDVDTSAQN